MNWRKTLVRSAWWSFTTSLVVITLLWAGWWLSTGQLQKFFGDIAYPIFLPALGVAALLSGNVHALNPIAWFVSMVIQLFLMIYVVVIATTVARQICKRSASTGQ